MPGLREYQEKMLPAIHAAIKTWVDEVLKHENGELHEIFVYHLGLNESTKEQGKRVRPLLVLVCNEGAGGDWRKAMPAAAAVELIHNYSLIHDDIEDNGLVRRGKETVWKRWGLAKGLNAGDAMQAAAFRVIEKLREDHPIEIAFQAGSLLSQTCLQLNAGQQMDIGFQEQQHISLDQYLQMIGGKTAALLGCCCQMGALTAGKDATTQKEYQRFGRSLGMAFQIYDDWLGIWGDEGKTGKSVSGDLVEGKKSMPVILGLEKSTRFQQRWEKGKILPEETGGMAEWLKEDGIEELVIRAYQDWSEQAMQTFQKMDCVPSIKEVLAELTRKLIKRGS